MRFLLLGPVEVREGERRLAPGGSKQRALLAILLLNANEVVSAERLIDGLCGEEPPATAPKMLQVFVSRLRSELAGAKVIETRAPGYVATVGPDELDILRFDELVAAGRSEMAGDPPKAAATLREALSLWRGPPLSDVSVEPFAQLAIPKLEEMHLSALEDRIDADLAAGRHHEVVAELQDLVAQHPLRERERGQLMVALYRDGRQAEALQAYRDARETLIDELGVEPSRDLQQLEAAILNQDTELDAPKPPARVPRSTVAGDIPAGAKPARRRRSVALVVGLAVLIAAVGTAAAWRHGRHGLVTVRANSVAIVDAGSGTVVDDIAVGTDPIPITISEDSAWVGCQGDHTIERISLAKRDITWTPGMSLPPTSLAYGNGSVWVGEGFAGTMARIIPASNELVEGIYPAGVVGGQIAITTSPGDLWVGLANHDLVRLDPASLQQKGTFTLPFKPLALSIEGDAVWSIAFPGYASWIARTAPADQPQTTPVRIESDPKAIASGDGAVWVGTAGNDLVEIDPNEAAQVDSVGLTSNPVAIAVQPGAVWVAEGNGTLESFDPTGLTPIKTINLGRPIGGMAIDSNDLWITLD
jgi:DNA-binding SARP family transcriptional activator